MSCDYAIYDNNGNEVQAEKSFGKVSLLADFLLMMLQKDIVKSWLQ